MSNYHVIIVGTGHAGAQAAIFLRQQGFSGSILMLGEELHLPYERPALSKEYFAKQKTLARMVLRPEQFWHDKQIEIRLGHKVVAIDASQHRLQLDSGEFYGYQSLIWATGGKPRRLNCAGAALEGIHYIRNPEDVDRIHAQLDRVKQAVVIGGGYIGLEAASALSKIGIEVSVLEAQPRLLARVAGPSISDFYQTYHQQQGVKLYLGQALSQIVGQAGQVRQVILDNGTQLQADLVIVGVGLQPEVEVLQQAGARCSNGIDIDPRCRSSLPDIYAIGDCANHQNHYAQGQRIRLESVQNANDQALVVAKQLTGKGEDYRAIPWFWSNQYDLKLQTIGLSMGFDQELIRGSVAQGSFSVLYLQQGKLLALDCVNRPQDFIQGRAWLLQDLSNIAAAALQDGQQSLKALGQQYHISQSMD